MCHVAAQRLYVAARHHVAQPSSQAILQHMQISLRQKWKLAHIMALALILMAAFFAALVLLPFPNLFFENTLYYLVIVPYVLTTLPFELAMQDPHALPAFNLLFMGLYALVIYTFFFALVTTFVGKKKVIPVTYVGLYVVLALVFDKLFGHLF